MSGITVIDSLEISPVVIMNVVVALPSKLPVPVIVTVAVPNAILSL